MFCAMCENDKELKAKRVTRKFDESGLDNITLKGVTEYKCPKCGEVYYNFGNIEQLHDLIAMLLVRKRGLLSPKEIRFLRKHMGYSSAMLAKLTGHTPESISRIENGKNKVTDIFDHYIRAMVIQKSADRDYDLHDHILNDAGEDFSRLEARLKGNKWDVRLIA